MQLFPSLLVTPKGAVPDCPEPPLCSDMPCDQVFARIVVNPLVVGPTVISWELREDFIDPPPLQFTLEVNEIGDGNEWETVDSVIDAYQIVDTIPRRTRSIDQQPRYRLTKESSVSTYTTPDFSSESFLTGRNAGIFKVALASCTASAKMSASFQKGYLFKRRQAGLACPRCLDLAGRPTDANCPICRGTGIYCGYLAPQTCTWADPMSRMRASHLVPGDGLIVGTKITQGMIVPAQMIAGDDLWISAVSDDRYLLRDVVPLRAVAGVPVMSQATFEMQDHSSILYELPLPDVL